MDGWENAVPPDVADAREKRRIIDLLNGAFVTIRLQEQPRKLSARMCFIIWMRERIKREFTDLQPFPFVLKSISAANHGSSFLRRAIDRTLLRGFISACGNSRLWVLGLGCLLAQAKRRCLPPSWRCQWLI
jgi:hypothetical protein